MTSEEIKRTVSMTELVWKYGLYPNRAGFIRCPFHDGDKNASLKIYKDSFYCFGCGASGDVFLALFRGMNANTELKQRMQLRSIDTGQIKDPKERARIRHAQMAIAIPLPEMDDEAIGDAFASVF